MANVTSTPAPDAVALEVRHTFPAFRQRVFAAWTSAEALKRWFAPENATVENVQIDFRVGGRYQVDIRANDGVLHIVVGAYREIDPPTRIVFTWRWQNHPHATDTIVSVDFIERDAQTEVVLTHERLTTEQDRAGHRHGWVGCFDKLAAILSDA